MPAQMEMEFDTTALAELPVPEIQAARAARDEGIEQVLENAGEDWKAKALNVLRNFTAPDLIGEDLRLACEQQGIFPHHPNAWGGLIATAVKAGMIVATGEYRSPKSKKTHARKSQVYRRTA